MKNKIKKIKQVVILLLTMLLVSCSKDTYEEVVQETKKPLKVKNLKARDLKKQGNLVKKLDHFKAFTKLQNLNHKTETSSIYDFSIDTNNFKLIENDRVKYYTFKVNRTIDNGMLENLQITKKTDGTYVAKLLQYSLSTSEKALLLSGGRLDVNGKLKVVNIEDPDFLSNINLKFRGDCFDMIITTQENLCALGGHSYGQACPLPPNQQPKPDSYVYTVVSGPCGDSGDNGLGDGVFSPPGGLGNQPLEPLDAFLTSLSAEQQQWLDNQSETTQGNIYSYLNVNNYNTTSSNFIKNLIDNCNINGNTPEVINEANNILDLLTNGTINNQPVDFGNSTPITNMTQYLSCFNTSQGATLTISADQPVAGEHNLFLGGLHVGHSFITIKQGNKVRSLGFYPKAGAQSIIPNLNTPDPNDFINTPGEFHNNQSTSYDVSLSVPITASQLSNLINGTVNFANNNPVYNLSSLNCTDIAIMMFEGNTNVNLPSCESPSPLWDGQTPGTLGEIIRDLPTPVGGTIDTNGGTSPQNNG